MQANYSRRVEGKEVSVGGELFVIYPFGAFTAANLSGELGSMLGPVIGSIAPLVADKKISLDDDVATAAPQLATAFSSLSGDKLERLMKKLLCSKNIVTKTDGEWLTEEMADEIFCGKVDEMFQACFFCAQGELRRFFRESRQPLWKAYSGAGAGGVDPERYGHLDTSQFGELELRLFTLIKAGIASKWELESCYSLG